MVYYGRGNQRLGQVVRRGRLAKGWSEAELAAQTGLSATYIHHIEGNTQKPSKRVAERLIVVLELSDVEADKLRAFYATLPARLTDRIILFAADTGCDYDDIQERLQEYKLQWVRSQRVQAQSQARTS